MRTASTTRRAGSGFTLLELVFTVVILGALTKFAMMKLVTPATMTLQVQAQSLADLIRRGQSLAVVRGQRISVTPSVANGRVNVACAAAPCNTDTSFTVSQGVTLGSASTTIYFNSLGQPVDSTGAALTSDASFPLSYGAATCTVTVATLTGRVSVSP